MKEFHYICDAGQPNNNVLLDDKAGMDAKEDWFLIEKELKRIGEWVE